MLMAEQETNTTAPATGLRIRTEVKAKEASPGRQPPRPTSSAAA